MSLAADAEHGRFGRAAQSCGVSQPTLSGGRANARTSSAWNSSGAARDIRLLLAAIGDMLGEQSAVLVLKPGSRIRD